MNKIMCIIMLCSGLYACSAGSSNAVTIPEPVIPPTDVQVFTSSESKSYGVSSPLNYSYSITGSANSCKIITATGNCTVNIKNYSGTGTAAGPLSLSLSTFSSDIATKCLPATSSAQSCTFTITNMGTTEPEPIVIYSNSRSTGDAFTLAGT